MCKYFDYSAFASFLCMLLSFVVVGSGAPPSLQHLLSVTFGICRRSILVLWAVFRLCGCRRLVTNLPVSLASAHIDVNLRRFHRLTIPLWAYASSTMLQFFGSSHSCTIREPHRC